MLKFSNLPAMMLMFILALGVTSCGDDEDSDSTTTITATAQADADLSILVDALVKADLATTLEGGSYTVFAPTNEALTTFLSVNGFASLDAVPTDVLTQVLLNHVVAGNVMSTDLSTGYVSSAGVGNASSSSLSLFINTTNGVVINGISTVTTADIAATNGTIHKVNAVIGMPSVVTHALANPDFSILVEALTRPTLVGNYVDVLSGTGPFTVFAPTNQAFVDVLGELGLPDLAAVPDARLEQILQYHVVTVGNVRAADITDGQVVPTFEGASFTINTTNGVVITDESGRTSEVVATDVQANNGVIHAINKVIVPLP